MCKNIACDMGLTVVVFFVNVVCTRPGIVERIGEIGIQDVAGVRQK